MIYNCTETMKTSKIGLELYGILDDLGFRGGINRLLLYNNRYKVIDKNALEKACDYFYNRDKEIDEICSMLADDFSRIVLRSMIRYRCTGNYQDLPKNSFTTQYFGNTFFSYKENECFVDCGAYDGDTIIRFMRLMRKRRIKGYKTVAFEPEPVNIEKLRRISPYTICIEKGVWDKEDTLYFKTDGMRSSLIDGKGDMAVDVTAIDLCEECRDATFIKMDIEGAEYNALIGAKNTILCNKPKLAICIYHSNEDMLRLIRLVKEMVPEYRIFVRQHTNALSETVMYAILR